MDRDAAPAADAPPPSDAPPAADAPPTADPSGTSTAALSPVADVHDTPTTADSQVPVTAAAFASITDAPPPVHGDIPDGAVPLLPAPDQHHPQVAIGAGLPLLPLVYAIDAAQQVPVTGEAFASITDAPPPVHGFLPDGALPLLPAPDQHHPQVAIGTGLPLLPLVNAIDAAQQVPITGEAFASITDAPPPVDGDLPDGALPLLPAPDQHHPQVAIGAGLPVLPLVNAIDAAQQVAVGVPTPDRFGHQAHPVAPLFGEGSLNRPNSKGKVPERLERRYMSRDDSVNNKNQALKALYGDLLAMKVDYQAAMMSGKKKEAQHARKNYQNTFQKAEGLRRDISSNGTAPVPQPKGVTKDLR